VRLIFFLGIRMLLSFHIIHTNFIIRMNSSNCRVEDIGNKVLVISYSLLDFPITYNYYPVSDF
jgi:hypothetical protein